MEVILNETGDGVVKTVRQRERRASFTARLAIAGPDMSEKLLGRIGRRCFGES